MVDVFTPGTDNPFHTNQFMYQIALFCISNAVIPTLTITINCDYITTIITIITH